MFAGNLEKDKEIKPTLLIPREFDIKPSSHLLGEKLSLLHTLHLEAQPIPNILSSFQGIKRTVGIVEGEENAIRIHKKILSSTLTSARHGGDFFLLFSVFATISVFFVGTYLCIVLLSEF